MQDPAVQCRYDISLVFLDNMVTAGRNHKHFIITFYYEFGPLFNDIITAGTVIYGVASADENLPAVKSEEMVSKEMNNRFSEFL